MQARGCLTLILQARGCLTLILIYTFFSLSKTLLWLRKCRTAITPLFLYLNVCISVMLNSLWCPYTSISFFYYKLFFYTNLYPSVMLNSLSCPFTSMSFRTNRWRKMTLEIRFWIKVDYGFTIMSYDDCLVYFLKFKW